MEHQSNDRYEFAFDIDNVKLLKGVIDYALEVWPGSPKRPEIEQEFLWHMRDQLAKCIMDHSFYNLSIEDGDK